MRMGRQFSRKAPGGAPPDKPHQSWAGHVPTRGLQLTPSAGCPCFAHFTPVYHSGVHPASTLGVNLHPQESLPRSSAVRTGPFPLHSLLQAGPRSSRRGQGRPLPHHSAFTTLSSFGFSQGTQAGFSVAPHSCRGGDQASPLEGHSLAIPKGWRTSAGHWDDSDREPWKLQVSEEALPRTGEHGLMCGREKREGAWA